MEESGAVKGSDPDHRWIIDPIDGTTNFMHAVPFFAISVALERKGELVAGVTYNPVTDEMFTAEKGQGAFLNNRRLRVAARTDIHEALVCLPAFRIAAAGTMRCRAPRSARCRAR